MLFSCLKLVSFLCLYFIVNLFLSSLCLVTCSENVNAANSGETKSSKRFLIIPFPLVLIFRSTKAKKEKKRKIRIKVGVSNDFSFQKQLYIIYYTYVYIYPFYDSRVQTLSVPSLCIVSTFFIRFNGKKKREDNIISKNFARQISYRNRDEREKG